MSGRPDLATISWELLTTDVVAVHTARAGELLNPFPHVRKIALQLGGALFGDLQPHRLVGGYRTGGTELPFQDRVAILQLGTLGLHRVQKDPVRSLIPFAQDQRDTCLDDEKADQQADYGADNA